MGTDEKTLEAARKIRKYEDVTPKYDRQLGWSWHDVGVYPGTLNAMIVQGLVEVTYKSHSFTHYELTEKGNLLAEAGELASKAPPVSLPEVPDDLFDDIVGYDDIKELLLGSLSVSKPVHVLLYGPPALAKTMFLRVIEQLGGQLAVWITGSAASQAGLWDMLAERKPRWLLIDEVEKMNLPDVAGLLSLMETGRLVRTKVGRTLDEQLTVWVIAAANRINKLPPELLSRFAIVSVDEYGPVEFVQVVKKVLIRWEDIDEATAGHIANELVGKTHDVRDAVRVARLSSRIGVDRAIELLLKR